MTRGPLTLRETDLMRAIKCAVKAGLHVAGFKITKAGNIEVMTVGAKVAERDNGNEWDSIHDNR